MVSDSIEVGEEVKRALGDLTSGFRWGVATSAYQVEGARAIGGRGSSIWDDFEKIPGSIKNGDSGEVTADHYRRYPDDIKMMVEHKIDSYRFSIAWARIFPELSSGPNSQGLDHYERKLDLLLTSGIEPTVTLFHWDLPSFLEDLGGWYSRDIAKHFSDYAEAVVNRLGDRVARWITINEPWTVISQGYCNGLHAPGHRDYHSAGKAVHHMLLAHGLAVARLRESNSDLKIGITNILSRVSPWSNSVDDMGAAELMDAERNTIYLEALFRGRYPSISATLFPSLFDAQIVRDGDFSIIQAPIDFVGTNYYLDQLAKSNLSVPVLGVEIIEPEGPQMTTGTAIRPDGLYWAITKTREYTPLPQYVTEVGVCLPDYVNTSGGVEDPGRVSYLSSCLMAIQKSVIEGCDVRGIYVWSLLDNLEWNQGFGHRFGLFYVDYRTQERIPKTSAKWYSKVIEEFHSRFAT